MPTTTEIDRRHAVYYEAMLGAVFEMYQLSGIMGVGLFEQYREHILKAWSWAIDNSNRHIDAASLCISFARDRTELLSLRLEPAQLVSRLQSSVACARRQGDPKSSGRLLRELGAIHALNGQVQQSLICYLRSEEICREASDKEGEAMALSSQGKAYTQLHNNAAAIHCLERSFRIFREIEFADGEADALNGLGAAQLALGLAQPAVGSYEQSLAICRKTDNYRCEAIALCGLGDARMALDQLKEASELFAAALVLFRQLGDEQGETQVLSCISTAGPRANAAVKI
ncbi:MAG TPA: tetratricopeptide repeat protein [Pyrinomonadaceae bacterium]|nr:tetratricopeptide repeat protein [Pyrinomonadaceae bacterium]